LISRDGVARERSQAEIRTERTFLFGLVTLAVVSEMLYVRLVRFNAIDGLRPVATFVGYMVVLFAVYGLAFLLLRRIQFKTKGALMIVVLGAVVFRITMIPAGLPADASAAELVQLVRADLRGTAVSFDRYLLYDDDVWRYLWDGHVWANSEDPFRFAPADPGLDYLAASSRSDASGGISPWQDIRDNINHARISTIYPPLAQVVFRLSHALAPGSVVVLKTILIACDLFTVFVVHLVLRTLGSPPGWLLLYAWNPLLIKVVAGSGHVDVLAGALLALTAYLLLRRAYLSAAVALAGAALVKLAPLVLVPFLAKRIGWRRALVVPLVILAAYLPFLHSGWAVFAGFSRFAQEWEFNSAFFLLIQSLAYPFARNPAFVARVVGVLAILVCGVWFWRRDDEHPAGFPNVASYMLGALILFSPTVMPWYLVWLLPLAVLCQATVWICFTGVVCLAFFVMVNGTLGGPVLAIEYAIFLTIALLSSFSRRRQKPFARLQPAEIATYPADIRRGTTTVPYNHSEPIPQRRNP
jgi:alpha-1,6-mannosyltransferase